MSRHAKSPLSRVLMGTMGDMSLAPAAAFWPALAAPAGQSGIPNFAPDPNVGWISLWAGIHPLAIRTAAGHLRSAHPFINNAIEYNAARPGTKDESQQPTFPLQT